MFKEAVGTNEFTDEFADSLFSNINCSSYLSDQSMRTVLRAIFHSRIPDGESIRGDFSNVRAMNAEQRGTKRQSTVVKDTVGRYVPFSAGTIHFVNLIGQENDVDVFVKAAVKYFSTVFPGWEIVEGVTRFCSFFKCLCFVNPSIKSTIVIADNIGIRELHFLCGAAAVMFPWYFNKDSIQPYEMDLLRSFASDNIASFNAAVTAFSAAIDMRGKRLEKMLTGIEKAMEAGRKEELMSNIERIMRDLADLQNSITRRLEDKARFDTELFGIDMKLAETSDSVILNYFMACKHLDAVNVSGSRLTYCVRSTLDFFDEDIASRVISNKGSVLYETLDREFCSKDKFEMLMRKIFIEQKAKIRFCAAFKLNMTGTLEPKYPYRFDSPLYNTYMPNPHIQHFGCLGNNVRTINDAMARHDYVMAIEQSVASCKGLNFTDTVVMRHFVQDFTGTANKCVELADGTLLTPKEALEYFEKEGK